MERKGMWIMMSRRIVGCTSIKKWYILLTGMD